MTSGSCDVVVIGAGIVGLATAWQLQALQPNTRVVVLEKEARVARHQSGRSSGVVHSGIYYVPGSLKARACTRGRVAMETFCRERGISLTRRGKLIVASDASQLPQLREIFSRGQANGVRCEVLGAEAMRDKEPHVAGHSAIWVPEAGVVRFADVCDALVSELEAAGAEVRTRSEVVGLTASEGGWVVETVSGEVRASVLINAAGLYCDRIARMAGWQPELRIVPFRGEYWEISPELAGRYRGLVYPLPRPGLPFLGVHLTRDVDDAVRCGPNAVPAAGREGYTWGDVDARDIWDTLTWPGAWRLLARHPRAACDEVLRSLSRARFAEAVRVLAPDVQAKHLLPSEAGVRAQAVSPEGELIYDFMVRRRDRAVHVLNAPSPAATSSLEVGRWVAEEAMTLL